MLRIILIILIFFSCNSSFAKQNLFLMLKNNKVNVRYGPSFEYPIKFIYNKKYLPLKVIDKKDNFRRVIDHKKNSGWIHVSQLKKSNSLVVTKKKIMFQKSSFFSKPVVWVDIGRLLIIKKCKKNWCKVQTKKYKGWIETTNIWGAY